MQIELRNLSLSFGEHRVIDDVSARIAWDDRDDSTHVVALMGPSGAGKTTLARQILAARYDAPIEAVGIEPADAVIAYLPQTAVLFPNLPIMRNARLFEGVGRYRESFDPTLFDELTSLLGLQPLLSAGTSVARISGGEAQRLMLLRTLSIRPDLLLLDEPATGLDPSVRETFLIDLQDLLRRLDVCAIYIGHHWEEVRFLAGQVAFTETASDAQGRRKIINLPVCKSEAFAAAPPTIDAFRTVYGPGCSVWPLTGQGGIRIACFAAAQSSNPGFLRQAGSFRLSNTLSAQLRDGGRCRAAIYEDGRFVEWAGLTATEIVGALT